MVERKIKKKIQASAEKMGTFTLHVDDSKNTIKFVLAADKRRNHTLASFFIQFFPLLIALQITPEQWQQQ